MDAAGSSEALDLGDGVDGKSVDGNRDAEVGCTSESLVPARARPEYRRFEASIRASKSALPHGWKPNGEEAQTRQEFCKATEAGIDVNRELEDFIDHVRGNASTSADWDATFRRWLRKSVEFKQGRQKPSFKQSSANDERPPMSAEERATVAEAGRRNKAQFKAMLRREQEDARRQRHAAGDDLGDADVGAVPIGHVSALIDGLASQLTARAQ